MKVTIATSLGKGHVHIPPSKSMAHRAIICASLAKGRSVISNVAYSKDIRATIELSLIHIYKSTVVSVVRLPSIWMM